MITFTISRGTIRGNYSYGLGQIVKEDDGNRDIFQGSKDLQGYIDELQTVCNYFKEHEERIQDINK